MNTGLKTWTKRIVVFLVTAAMAIALIPFTGLKTVTKAKQGDEPKTAKLLADNGDGTYKLALSVTGEAEKVPVRTNVIVIFDISGSMNQNTGNTETTYTPSNQNGNNMYGTNDGETFFRIYRRGNWPNYYYTTTQYGTTRYTGQRYYQEVANQTRLAAAKDAVNALADALLSHNGEDGYPEDTFEMALVTFSTHAQEVMDEPTTSLTEFESAVNGLTATGGTNWEAALATAAGVDFDDTDQTFVIFVSDGNPTFRDTRGTTEDLPRSDNPRWTNNANYNAMRGDNYYYDDDGVYGLGSDDPDAVNYSQTSMQRCYDHALDDAQSLVTTIGADKFFTIGAYGDVSRMATLTTEAGAPSTNSYTAENTTALQEALASILEQIEMAGFAEVELKDPTTSQVEITGQPNVELLDIDPDSFKYYRAGGTNADGTTKYDPTENTITPIPAPGEEAVVQNIGEEWPVSVTEGDGGAPAADIDEETGMVDWDLSDLGVLENGVTYTVTFDVYPSQTTYDIIADLKNGTLTHGDLSKYPQEVWDYIVNNGEGSYSLKTNKDYPEVFWDDTRDDEPRQSSTITNPEPVATTAEEMTVQKIWIGVYGGEQTQPLEMEIMRGNKTDGMVKMDETIPLNTGNNYTNKMFIATGLLRVDKTAGTVTVLDHGHDYKLVEPENLSYHWELQAETMHPMLINGVLTMLTEYEGEEVDMQGKAYAEIDGKEYYMVDGVLYVAKGTGAILKATNTRRSNFTLEKKVSGNDAPADAMFTFKLKLTDPINHAMSFSVFDPTQTGDARYVTMNEGVVLSTEGLTPNEQYPNRYYDVVSGTEITVRMKAGWTLQYPNILTGTEYEVVEVTTSPDMPTGFTFSSIEVQDTDLTSSAITPDTDNTITAEEYKVKGTAKKGNTEIRAIYTNNYNPVTVNPQVTKKVTGWDAAETFTFSIEPGNADTKAAIDDGHVVMPDPAIAETEMITIPEGAAVGAETVSFGDITFYRTGTYTFLIKETNDDPEENSGWTYANTDDDAKTITVTVSADNTGKLSATLSPNTPVEFTNSYAPAPTTAVIEVEKKLTGRDLEDEEFEFQLFDTDGLTVLETVKNNEDGEVIFGARTFNAVGTFAYTIKEVVPEDDEKLGGVTYDTSTITATVTVSDDGSGTLKATVAYTPNTATFTNTYGASGSYTPELTKELTGRDLNAGEFTFTLTGNGDTPMTASNNAEGQVVFSPITYSSLEDVGEHVYTIAEVIPEEDDEKLGGVTYDTSTITLTVTVTDAGDGTLTTSGVYSMEEPTFTNTYEASGAFTPEVEKVLEGRALEEGEFKFTISEEGDVLETVSNAEDGIVSFSEIEYDLDDVGEHVYTIAEVIPEEDDEKLGGVTYDTRTITLTVTVTDAGDGTLTTSGVYSMEEPTFTNTYSVKPVSVDPPVQKIFSGVGAEKLYNNGKFTFTITNVSAVGPEDKTAIEVIPMPKNTSITNSAEYELPEKAGFYEFGPITFTQPGTYKYKVTESGKMEGVTNDPEAETGKILTFVVTDNGEGQLEVNPTTDQVQMSFTNKYVPQTGDNNNIALLLVIMGLALAAGGTGTILLKKSRKRN